MMKKGALGLFVLLVAILIVSPKMLYNLYNNILGKVVLIALVSFLAMNNVTLGLLGVLYIIIVLKNYDNFIEGMDNIGSPYTVGDDNVDVPTDPNVKKVITKEEAKKKLSELKEKANESGVDINDIKDAIASKESNSIPVNKNSMNSSESVQAFTPSMLTSSSIEGFCGACAAAI
jgi:hypothetical protein